MQAAEMPADRALTIHGGRAMHPLVERVVTVVLLGLCDALVTVVLSWGLLLLISPVLTTVYWLVALKMVLVVFTCLAIGGLYTHRLPALAESERVTQMISVGFGLMALLIPLFGVAPPAGLWVVLLLWLNLNWALPVSRIWFKGVLARAGIWYRPLLILATEETATDVLSALKREPSLGYGIAGFLTATGRSIGQVVGTCCDREIQVIGRLTDAERLMRQHQIREVAVVLPHLSSPALAALVEQLQGLAHTVHVVPNLAGLPVMGMDLSYFFAERTPVISIRRHHVSAASRVLKRAGDFVVALFLLIVTLPLMALVALVVKLDGPGPVLFLDRRLGRYGRPFTCLKFRTMHPESEAILAAHLARSPLALAEWDEYRKLRNHDPRVTRVGLMLRRLSLDELPQLCNVLKGEMSLVGPRPYLVTEEVAMGPHREAILQVPPGMTGLWQVMGRNEINFAGRLALESWYVRNWSVWLDGVILIRTIGVVLSRRGAA